MHLKSRCRWLIVVSEVEDDAFSRSNTINLHFSRKDGQTQHSDASLSEVLSINHTMKYVLLLYEALLQTFYPLAMCCNYWFITVFSGSVPQTSAQWKIYCSSWLYFVYPHTELDDVGDSSCKRGILRSPLYSMSCKRLETKCISMKINYSSLRIRALISP